MAGGVRKQGGKWLALWRENGVKKSKIIGPCSEMTKTRAREAVDEIVKRVKASTNAALFGPFVETVYYPFCKRKWKVSTRSKTMCRINVHLVRQFKDCELSVFRRDALQDFLDEKANASSYSVVNHLRWDLKAIFDMAIAEGLIKLNPAALLFTPKSAARPVHRVLTVQETAAVLKALDCRERLIAKLAVLGGMRPGEIFALTWADVGAEFFEVKRRVYEGEMDTPKSERGFRKVALTDGLLHDLEVWSEQTGRNASAFVFPSERGTPLSKHNVWRRNMQPKLKAVDLAWANFQVMRRTFVTLSKLAGGDPKVIADQAGHDLGVSLAVYAQSPLESKLKVVNALEKLILG